MNKSHISSLTNQYIIEKYGLEEILCPKMNINEGFIQELLRGNEKDWNDTIDILKKMGVLIPRLIVKLTKLGARTSVNLVVAVAKRAYSQGMAHKKVVLNLFYALVFILAGYTGGKIIEKYNENPAVPNTQMEMKEDTLEVINTEEGTTTVLSKEKDGVKFTEVQSTPNNNPNSKRTVIKLNEKGQTSPSFYKVSDKMSEAIFECEHCILHLYDANNPKRKLTKKDLLNRNVDLTIGAGHKLTPKERKSAKLGMKITRQEALALFKKDIHQKEIELNNAMKRDIKWLDKVTIPQNFFDGLFSVTFNTGIGNLAGNARKSPSELWNRLCNCRIDTKNNCMNQNDINYVIAQAKKQNITHKGHVYRRAKESEIMLYPQTKDYHLISTEYRNN